MTMQQNDYGYEGIGWCKEFSAEEFNGLQYQSYTGTMSVEIKEYNPEAYNGFGSPIESALVEIVFQKGDFSKTWHARVSFRTHFKEWDSVWEYEVLAYLCDEEGTPIRNRGHLQYFFDYSTTEEGHRWDDILLNFYEDRNHMLVL